MTSLRTYTFPHTAAGVRQDDTLFLYLDGELQVQKTIGSKRVKTLTVNIGLEDATEAIIEDAQLFDDALFPEEIAELSAIEPSAIPLLGGAGVGSPGSAGVSPASDDGPVLLGDSDGPVTTTITYYYLNGQRVAQAKDGVFTWIHADHLSSATRITDVNGLEVRRLAYAAFGEEAENQGSGDDPKYTYTGKEHDATGLYYYGARYYDPALSRFITADTVYDAGPQGLNRYAYALNNPIIYRDPTGQYIDADLDPDYVRNSGADENGYGDGPTASGNVTGSAQQIHEGMAAVHNYYGTHPLAYWHGLAGGPEPSMTAWEIAQAGGMLFACAAGPVGFAVSVAIAPYQQVAAEYYRERGYNTVATVVEHGDIVIGIGVEAGIAKTAGILDNVVEAGVDDVVEVTSSNASKNADEILKRSASGKESASRLDRLAKESLENPAEQIHGISTTAGKPRFEPYKELPRSEVEKYFPVHNTPMIEDPLHRTVELPDPVTKEVADTWNNMWGFTKKKK